jgi:hypothetical protein
MNSEKFSEQLEIRADQIEDAKVWLCDACYNYFPPSEIAENWGNAKLCMMCDLEIQDDMETILGDEAHEGF